MIEVPRVITAGGSATLMFELTDSDNQRLANIRNGTATVSLRKEATPRTRHELTHLPTTFDPVAATVQLDLTTAHTKALSPPIEATGKQALVTAVGDVQLVYGTKVEHYGPFRFRLRLPETYA